MKGLARTRSPAHRAGAALLGLSLLAGCGSIGVGIGIGIPVGSHGGVGVTIGGSLPLPARPAEPPASAASAP